MCTTRAASTRSSPRTTTEMRISEVEIISMLMPGDAERLEEGRRDAGVRAHAGADDRELADLVVVHEVLEADLGLIAGESPQRRRGIAPWGG